MASTVFRALSLSLIHIEMCIRDRPYNRNGLKFFNADGGLEHADITDLLETAAVLSAGQADISKVSKVDLIILYAQSLCEKIRLGVKADDYDRPLAGLHIVVDAGNGAGGFFVRQVLEPLGADTDVYKRQPMYILCSGDRICGKISA